MTTTLVLGIGNTLAGDDGIGALVAERLRDRTGVRIIVVHQITPELAEEVAAAARVVFVDASLTGTGVEVEPVKPAAVWPALGHALAPAELLSLTASLYDHVPEAFAVKIPGGTFAAGMSPSTDAHRRLPEAIRALEALMIL